MERGEFVASLATDMLAATFPAACGANWTWNAKFCPAAMETADIPPTTLKLVLVIVPDEIVTAAVPVLVSVNVWELLEPAVAFPKLRFVALAASVPDEAVLELVLAAGVPALVNPVHPETDKAARRARTVMSEASGLH